MTILGCADCVEARLDGGAVEIMPSAEASGQSISLISITINHGGEQNARLILLCIL